MPGSAPPGRSEPPASGRTGPERRAPAAHTVMTVRAQNQNARDDPRDGGAPEPFLHFRTVPMNTARNVSRNIAAPAAPLLSRGFLYEAWKNRAAGGAGPGRTLPARPRSADRGRNCPVTYVVGIRRPLSAPVLGVLLRRLVPVQLPRNVKNSRQSGAYGVWVPLRLRRERRPPEAPAQPRVGCRSRSPSALSGGSKSSCPATGRSATGAPPSPARDNRHPSVT